MAKKEEKMAKKEEEKMAKKEEEKMAKKEEERPLTEEEIDSVLSVIPKVRAAAASIAKANYRSILSVTRKQLGEIRIKPSKIDKLKAIIYNQCIRSEVQPGENIGLVAAEAVSQPITQATLNSFHNSGDRYAAGGTSLNSFTELFNLSQSRKDPKCHVHMMEKHLSFDQALSLSRAFVSVSLESLLIQTSGTSPLATEYSTAEEKTMEMEKELESSFQRKDSFLSSGKDESGMNVVLFDSKNPIERMIYPLFFAFAGLSNLSRSSESVRKRIFDGVPFLRLRLNRWALFSNRITPTDIANVISTDPGVFCVTSPTALGIIDIHVDPDNLTVRTALSKKISPSELEPNENRMLYMQMVLIPRLKNETTTRISSTLAKESLSLSVRGQSILPKSMSLAFFRVSIPVSKDVVELAMSDIVVSAAKGSLQRTIWLNPYVEPVTGIPRSSLINLINLVLAKQEKKLSKEKKSPQTAEETFSEFVISKVIQEAEDSLIVALSKEVHEFLGSAPNALLALIKQTTLEELNAYHLEIDAQRKRVIEEVRKRNQMTEGGGENISTNERRKKRSIQTKTAEAIASMASDLSTLLSLPERSPILLNSTYVYLLCRNGGRNLSNVMIHPAVNPQFTISNNPHEILEVLGIEASRAWVYRELYDLVMATGKTINPRHIQIIADEMSTTGTLMPFTARGSARQNHGAFSEASFEQALQAFKRSAISGQQESVKSTSASVLIGNRCAFGTGCFYVGTSTELKTDSSSHSSAFVSERRMAAICQSAAQGATSVLGVESEHAVPDNQPPLSSAPYQPADGDTGVAVSADAFPTLESMAASLVVTQDLQQRKEDVPLPPLADSLSAFQPLTESTSWNLASINLTELQRRFHSAETEE